jgi:TolB-like protein/DNA-binding winged helix-turn-helix (wHTH) protein/Flp pilus assembly protein TadD
MDVPPASGVLRFGEVALDLATGELHRTGDPAPVVLGARPARLLALLAWRHGTLVTRDAIQAYVWADGTTVDFDQSINQHIRQLRQTLGDSAAHPAWIQTLPARGYRFLVAGALDPPHPATSADRLLAPPAARDASDARPDHALAPPAARDTNDARPDHALALPAARDTNDVRAEHIPASAVRDATHARSDHMLAPPARDTSDARADHVLASAARVPSDGRLRAARRHRGLGAATLVGVAFAALLLAPSDSGSVTDAPTAEPAAAIRIAVLPLESDPADQPRAVTATEELIAALGEAYAPSLEIIALRTVMRYRGSASPPSTIARELGVDFVLEGRVRTQLDRTRITLGLVRGRDSAHVWMRTFEQSQHSWTTEAVMAQDVAAGLGRVLLPHRSRPDAALDVDAQQDLLRGRYLLRRDPRAAAQAFTAVTARVPRSAKAWAALAQAELRSGPLRFSAAAAAADSALALDPAHPDAHFVRAVTAFYGEWNIERARQHFTAAIASNPAFAEAHHDLAACYSATGRHDEAIAAMQRAFALDPRAPAVVSDVGWYYYFARRYPDAALWCQRTLALDDAFFWAHRCIVLSRIRQGDQPAAIAAALDDLRARGAPATVIAAVTATGLAPYWQWQRDRVAPEHGKGDHSDRAVSRLSLGDTDGALDDLERAATHHDWLVPFLSVDPTFDPLRHHPRFHAVLRTVAAGASL